MNPARNIFSSDQIFSKEELRLIRSNLNGSVVPSILIFFLSIILLVFGLFKPNRSRNPILEMNKYGWIWPGFLGLLIICGIGAYIYSILLIRQEQKRYIHMYKKWILEGFVVKATSTSILIKTDQPGLENLNFDLSHHKIKNIRNGDKVIVTFESYTNTLLSLNLKI